MKSKSLSKTMKMGKLLSMENILGLLTMCSYFN